MKMVLTGIGVIVLGYMWLVFIATSGYHNAWWYFRWSEFKPILLVFHLVGALIIGVGVLDIRKKKKQSPRQ